MWRLNGRFGHLRKRRIRLPVVADCRPSYSEFEAVADVGGVAGGGGDVVEGAGGADDSCCAVDGGVGALPVLVLGGFSGCCAGDGAGVVDAVCDAVGLDGGGGRRLPPVSWRVADS